MTYEEANKFAISNRELIETFLHKNVRLKTLPNSRVWKVDYIEVHKYKNEDENGHFLKVFLSSFSKKYDVIKFEDFIKKYKIMAF